MNYLSRILDTFAGVDVESRTCPLTALVFLGGEVGDRGGVATRGRGIIQRGELQKKK